MNIVKPVKRRRRSLCENCLLDEAVIEVIFPRSKHGTIMLCDACMDIPMSEIQLSHSLKDVKWSEVALAR